MNTEIEKKYQMTKKRHNYLLKLNQQSKKIDEKFSKLEELEKIKNMDI